VRGGCSRARLSPRLPRSTRGPAPCPLERRARAGVPETQSARLWAQPQRVRAYKALQHPVRQKCAVAASSKRAASSQSHRAHTRQWTFQTKSTERPAFSGVLKQPS
jgi:hypothetical protein